MLAACSRMAPLFRASIARSVRRQILPASRKFSLATNTATALKQSHTIENRLLKSIHPLHLFRIVQDVDRYQEFLPFCGHSEVFPNTISNGGRSFEADLAVGLGPLFQTKYRSQVTVDPQNLIISTVSGRSAPKTGIGGMSSGSMFETLKSRWELFPVVEQNNKDQDKDPVLVGTAVDFSVEMTVSDPMVETVLNNTLRKMAETQVEAFEERCLALSPPSKDELSRAETFFQMKTKVRTIWVNR